MNTLVEVISADINRLTEDLLEDHSARLFSRGGHFNKSQLIPVYFLLISGCYEEDTYNNFLYSLRDDIKKTNRPFAFIDTPLEEPGAAALPWNAVPLPPNGRPEKRHQWRPQKRGVRA